MTRKKLEITTSIFFEIIYDFDLKEYIDGDVSIVFYYHNKKCFSYETQMSYFINMLKNMLCLLLEKNAVMFFGEDYNIADDYIKIIQQNNNTFNDSILYKNFIDLYVNKNIGFMAFLFWRENKYFVNISKVKVSKKTEFADCNKVYESEINETILKKWLDVVDNILIGLGPKDKIYK